MNKEQLKNMIILRDIPSNIIDEAFVILKNNKKIKTLERVENKKGVNEAKEKKQEYIVKEAEMVISDYLSNIEKEKQIKSHAMKQIEYKYKRLKLITIVLSIVLFLNILL